MFAAPLLAKVAAVWALAIFRPWRHPAILALICFTAVSDLALAAFRIWSPIGVIADNTLTCVGIAAVAIYAVKSSPNCRLTLFQMAAVGASALVMGRILGLVFPPDTMRRMLVGVHFAAGSVAGVAVSSCRLDPMDDDVLRWLFVTRIARALQPAVIDLGRTYYEMANGAATIAWVVTCYLIVRHCVSEPAEPDFHP